MSEKIGWPCLLGKTPEEAVAELNKYRPIPCLTRFTGAPRGRGSEEYAEKRVIRIREKDGSFEVLVSMFQPPGFDR